MPTVTLWPSSRRVESSFKLSMHSQPFLQGLQVLVSKACLYLLQVVRWCWSTYSVKWDSDCDREEVILNFDRWFHARQSCRYLPKHWNCVLWHGPGLPSTDSQCTQECTSVLENLRRIPSHTCLNAGDRYCAAESHTIWVCITVIVEFYSSVIEWRQLSGVRPYGVSLLVAGWDINRGPTLWQVDPSGSYWAWKASAIGKNMVNAKTFLEKRWGLSRIWSAPWYD